MQPEDMKYKDWINRYGSDFQALAAKKHVRCSFLIPDIVVDTWNVGLGEMYKIPN
jgi:hypothetical protein